SGSAVVDQKNTSGFGTGSAPPLVAAYTSTGRGECIVSSLDRGRTWSEFSGNPVVRHDGRDPRLLWHSPTNRWVMAVYAEPGGKRRTWSGHFYAAQTFSDEPKGRRVQVGWAQGIAFPGMPFNQQMTVPCELTLRATEDGVRMFARPVAEVESLRGSFHSRT